MISRNVQIDLDDAEPGMTLSSPLMDAQGGVLLPAGIELTESTLTSLRRRGVDTITIVNDRISEADLAAERERWKQSIERLFRRCGERGASPALRQSVTRYRLGEPT